MILIRIQFQKIFGLEYHFISVMATSSIEFAQFVLNKIMEIIFYPKYCGIKFMWASFMDYKFLRGSIKRSTYIISWRAWLINIIKKKCVS